MSAIDAGNLARVADIWHAAPDLARLSFTGAFVGAVLIAGSDEGDPGNARQLIQRAIGQAGENGQAARLAGARRLRDLARIRAARADLLTELAGLLADGC